jgi:hypothetical protein
LGERNPPAPYVNVAVSTYYQSKSVYLAHRVLYSEYSWNRISNGELIATPCKKESCRRKEVLIARQNRC